MVVQQAADVVRRFRETPATIKVAEIDAQLDVLAKQYAKLKRERKKWDAISNEEQDKVADQLDKDSPGWRKLLIELHP